jgi:hypothetical protein
MNIGILILSGVNFLIIDITMFDNVSTAITATDIPILFLNELETARTEHIPIS